MLASQCTNHLSRETSPYLLQHAHNPVDWYPWGPEALEAARREDKPILLSIGYSACHWCHVMAHESFEDLETANLMNELFINIKVDREERPDLDKIYQTAHQLLTQRPGGWPLTMFLTPDNQTPFFGGTYFPREQRYGMPAFKDLVYRVHHFYREHREDIARQNNSLVSALDQGGRQFNAEAVTLNDAPLQDTFKQLENSFDQRYGGFGSAPKFPHPTNLEHLLRFWAEREYPSQARERALQMATFTLRKMALGGLYDQLGGGFCRYSVDERWMIPHFEKMLYDNAQLLPLYVRAWQASRDKLFARVAIETAEWVIRDMQSPEGGYYSTLDADSEGEEGRFYLWTPAEAEKVLDNEELPLIRRYFGLDGPPNFEGQWHLHIAEDIANLAVRYALREEEVESMIHSAREKLRRTRDSRVWPGRDEKVLTAWNGLMIKGMSIAGRVLERGDFVDSATRALDFIYTTLWRDSCLLATYKDGRAHLMAYLDDYAFLIEAILDLLQVRWRDADLKFALALADGLVDRFEDLEQGAFYFTAHDHEALIHRPKPLADDSIPAGNGVAALALARLGHLVGEPRYLEAAERTLKAAWPAISRLSYAHTTLLLALDEHLKPPQSIVLRGKPEQAKPWEDLYRQEYQPRRMSFTIPSEATDLPGVLAHRKAHDGLIAYVCNGAHCLPPITDKGALAQIIRA